MNYLQKAIDLLRRGEVIAAKTDTVYGLLADATNDSAVRKVFELKQRPFSKALIVLVDSLNMAKEIAEFSEEAEEFAKKIWIVEKKPVTLVLKAKNVSKLVTGGGDTVAMRLPDNEFCLELIKGLGKPVVAPSANISGHPTAISTNMVRDDFKDQILIIDGGVCKSHPSTIINLTGKKMEVLR